MRRLRWILGATAVTVVLLVAAAAPASASITTTTSALGAGYKSTPAGGVTSAKVKFKVPSITCVDDTRFDVLYLGVFGFNGSDSPTSFAEVFAACNMSLTPNYFAAAFTAGGGFQQLSVAIGDEVVTRLDENGTTTKATVRNLTGGTSVASSGNSANDASVLLGDFGNNPSIPTFGRIKMTGATVNALPFAHNQTPVVRERFRWDNTVQIATSLASDGDSTFIMQFRSNT